MKASAFFVLACGLLVISVTAGSALPLEQDEGEVLDTSIRQTSCTGGSRVRKEASDMSTAEWDRFIAAVRTLHRTPPAGGDSIFSSFIRTHGQEASQWHGGQYFLPAHRQMLWEYENALRRIDSSVTVPYYDWSINNARWTFDAVWGRVGGANGGPIPSPPFRGWRSPLPNNHLVQRLMVRNSLTNGDGDRVASLESRGSLNALIASTTLSFRRFADYLELVHGLPHIEIGRDMSDGLYSPSDPVFYLHHAFIDKIWRDWQLRGAGNRFDGLHDGVRVSLDTRMRPLRWGRTVRQILTGISTCVTYQAPSRGSGARLAFSDLSAASSETNQASIAEEKAKNGAAYKAKIQKVKTEQEELAKGAQFSNLPDSTVQAALELKREIQVALEGVLPADAENPNAVLSKSDAAVQSDGQKTAKSLSTNPSPSPTDGTA